MMHPRIGRLSIAALAATALPIGGAVALAASPAGTSTLKVKCTTFSGSATGTVTLSGCSGNTGGADAPAPASTLETGGTIHWVNGKKTKVGPPTLGTGLLCPAGDTDNTFKGPVLSDTTGSMTVPGKYKGEVCEDPNGNISLAPGTKFVLK